MSRQRSSRGVSPLRIAVFMILGSIICFGIFFAVLLGVPFVQSLLAPTNNFLPLPPPVAGNYRVSMTFQSLGENSQQSSILAAPFGVSYEETGGQVGGIAHQIYNDHITNRSATMQQVEWADWNAGRIRIVEYTDANQQLLGGIVQLDIPNASWLQLVNLQFGQTVDRSNVKLIYVSDGNTLQLRQIVYMERWGASTERPWAMGLTAVWTDDPSAARENYRTWGFWETNAPPIETVTNALSAVRTALQNVSNRPTFVSYDSDGLGEIIGRQTGMRMEQEGAPYGTIAFTYDRTWGRAPNTAALGSGALSRIDWNLADGRTYSLLVLSPQFSTTPSALYIFTDNIDTANRLYSAPNWVALYPQLRAGQIPGVLLAIHAMGHLETISTSGAVLGGEGGSVSVDIGASAGVAYSTLGNPSFEQVGTARNLLALLGENGQRALGLYYTYAVNSGSGLNYYLATLNLLTAPTESRLMRWETGINLLDLTGVPALDQFLPVASQ